MMQTMYLSLIVTAATILPFTLYAQEFVVKEVEDIPAVKNNNIVDNLFREGEDLFTPYPYNINYVIYTTHTSDMNEVISSSSYNWSGNTRQDEVKLQLSLAFPFWHEILEPNLVFKEFSLFRETNYKPQLFLGFDDNYEFTGWTLRDVEVDFNHDSNGSSNPILNSRNRAHTRLVMQTGKFMLEVKPWYIIDNYDEKNDNITKYIDYYQLKLGCQLGKSLLIIKVQYNWNTDYGGTELNLSYSVSKHVRLYTEIYSGYGESLIGYNFNQTRLGIGVMLNNIFK